MAVSFAAAVAYYVRPLPLAIRRALTQPNKQSDHQTTTMGGGHHHANPEASPRPTQDLQSLSDAKIPLAFRDTCAHLLVPLNKCRRTTWWSPNKCGHERHTYEECLWNSYLQRCEAKVQVDKVMAAKAREEED
eukprot:CAMPEP_0178725458 /NCGR_PEP_ID=MMETSP0699-20121125/26690_1 /TAXON_ID=265572 /ORGANISM="Extubocellulus spinifer, Strain CCMP396" /LENGTH=132 /DNA_ID=CAMNT_0020376805 /DNA_START=217 /DNA_END=615 /DNA_ORIENTATION=-